MELVYLYVCVVYFGLIWTHPSFGLGEVTLGVVDNRMMEYASDALSSCRHHDKITLEAIPAVDGSNILEKAERLKTTLGDRKYFAMIGPAIDHVMLVAENADIPYLVTNNYNKIDLDLHVYSILPEFSDAISCIWALLDTYKWTTIGLMWEEPIVGKAILDLFDADRLDVHAYRIDNHTSGGQIRDALRHIRQKRFHKIVVLTHPRTSERILDTAMKLGMLSVPMSWLIAHFGSVSDFDAMLNDIETNLTVIQVCPEALPIDPSGLLFTDKFAVEKGITFICDVLEKWPQSTLETVTLPQLIKQVQNDGGDLTLKFDANGNRVEYSWNISVHNINQFVKMAEWHKLTNSSHLDLYPYNMSNQDASWMEQIRVVSILERPWTMLKEGKDESCRGNDCFEGFMIDLMDKVAAQFTPKLQYDIYIVPDGQFGSLDPETGLWNGVMAELVSRNATMSLAPLSINNEREQAVDFSKPFKTRGISVLIRTPVSQTSFFQFLAPLSTTIWFVVLIAMVIVGIALGEFEKHGTQQRRDIAKITPRESFWFVFGSLVQEGTESTPLTVAGRILIASWWFFAMILLSSYTANLAAFLTVTRINSPIQSVSDLLNQNKIQYGSVQNSGVISFFEKTEIEPFRTMFTRMRPENHVASSEEGLKRIMEGNYAFLWDDTVTSYTAEMNCNFTEIGPSFDPKGYGIGVPSGAIYRENLTLAVLALADQGVIDTLQEKWWNSGDCPSRGSREGSDTEEMHIENIAGIFFVLLGGLILGFIACIIDKYGVPAIVKLKERHKHNVDPDERNNVHPPVTTHC